MNSILQLFGVMMAVTVPGCLVIFVNEYFKYKRSTNSKLEELRKELKGNSTADMEAQISELKERIVVLEAIVTDRGFELDRKINNL